MEIHPRRNVMEFSGRSEEVAVFNDQKQEETKTQFRITSTPTTKTQLRNMVFEGQTSGSAIERKMWNSMVEDNL